MLEVERLRRVTHSSSSTSVEEIANRAVKEIHRLRRLVKKQIEKPFKLIILKGTSVEYTDGLWTYHNAALNLWGQGNHRADAFKDFHDNFIYLWKELVENKDNDVLDEKASEVKRNLLVLLSLSDAPS